MNKKVIVFALHYAHFLSSHMTKKIFLPFDFATCASQKRPFFVSILYFVTLCYAFVTLFVTL